VPQRSKPLIDYAGAAGTISARIVLFKQLDKHWPGKEWPTVAAHIIGNGFPVGLVARSPRVGLVFVDAV
jgi:hypothetical protein